MFWNQNHKFIKRFFDRFGEVWAESHDGAELAPGEKRLLVLNVRVEDTLRGSAATRHAPATTSSGSSSVRTAGVGATRATTASPSRPGSSRRSRTRWVRRRGSSGTPEQVAEGIQFFKDTLSLQDLVLFPNFSGDTYEKTDEQMTRLAEEVLPLVK